MRSSATAQICQCDDRCVCVCVCVCVLYMCMYTRACTCIYTYIHTHTHTRTHTNTYMYMYMYMHTHTHIHTHIHTHTIGTEHTLKQRIPASSSGRHHGEQLSGRARRSTHTDAETRSCRPGGLFVQLRQGPRRKCLSSEACNSVIHLVCASKQCTRAWCPTRMSASGRQALCGRSCVLCASQTRLACDAQPLEGAHEVVSRE